MAATTDGRPRIVIVGAGFAGFHAAKRLCRLARGGAEIVVVNPTDYFLYLTAGGCCGPARSSPHHRLDSRIASSGPPRARLRGHRRPRPAPGVLHRSRGGAGELGYDRLLLTTGSVGKLLPIPGVAEHAHGFRDIAEALYFRDHVIRQIELADDTDDLAEREARLTFVVVGAGYTGTEVAAQGVLLTDALFRTHPRLNEHAARWLLVDIADRVLPGLDERLSRTAARVLGRARRRGSAGDLRAGGDRDQRRAERR